MIVIKTHNVIYKKITVLSRFLHEKGSIHDTIECLTKDTTIATVRPAKANKSRSVDNYVCRLLEMFRSIHS